MSTKIAKFIQTAALCGICFMTRNLLVTALVIIFGVSAFYEGLQTGGRSL